jgi:hypothetical protein
MCFPNPFRYYRVFGAALAADFPLLSNKILLPNLVFFRSLLGISFAGDKPGFRKNGLPRTYNQAT